MDILSPAFRSLFGTPSKGRNIELWPGAVQTPPQPPAVGSNSIIQLLLQSWIDSCSHQGKEITKYQTRPGVYPWKFQQTQPCPCLRAGTKGTSQLKFCPAHNFSCGGCLCAADPSGVTAPGMLWV